MKLKELLESFYKGIKLPWLTKENEYVEAFKNPSKKEMDTVADYKEVSFIADSSNNSVYVYRGVTDHNEIIHHLKLPFDSVKLFGNTKLEGEKYKVTDLRTNDKSKVRKSNWRWIEDKSPIKL